MKPFSTENKLGKYILSLVQHYNHNKYWKRRHYVVSPSMGNIILKLYYLFWIKRIDSYHNCSFGTNINMGENFASPPKLPHGPNGIIVASNSTIGYNCVIYQQVTIGGGTVGNNVLIGSKATVLHKAKIGNNCKIGANCVVFEDIPDNSTVVLPKPRIIMNNK